MMLATGWREFKVGANFKLHHRRALQHRAHSFPLLVGGALRGLRLLHVVLEEHEAAELLQKRLDSVVPVPSGQHRNSPGVHLQHKLVKIK